MSDVVTGVLVAAGVLGVGIVVYVVGSFAHMHAHTERRGAWALLRAAIREMFWSAVIEPLVPLYYVIGRRMGNGRGRVPVVFVHGYSQNRANFLRLARALSRSDAGALYGFNYPWPASISGNAARLGRFVDRVLRETGAEKVDLVCHSLGGLVALEYLSTSGAAHVRKCVTIAAPHGGVVWRGPIPGAAARELRKGCAYLAEYDTRALAVPCLSIFSTHDNVVHPGATSSLAHRGGRDIVIPHVAHLSILFAPETVSAVTSFVTSEGEAV